MKGEKTMGGLHASTESQNYPYDSMKLSVVKKPNGTFDLGVGLHVQSERHHYREYQTEFSTYLRAPEYMKERVVVYQKTNRLHRTGLTIAYNLQLPEWDCPRSEKTEMRAEAA